MTNRLALLCLLLASPLYFVGLGWPLFWADEATTAILSRHVLDRGVPYVGHGTDSASQAFDNMRAIGDVDVHSSWLQYYIGALALASSGSAQPVDDVQSAERVTFFGRLPFALIGLAASVVFAWALRDALRHGPYGQPEDADTHAWADRVAGAALALSALSPVMVLHSRQFRYYTPAALCTVLVLHAYLELHREGRRRPALLATASAALVTANDLAWIAVHTALFVHYGLLERRHVPWRRFVVPLMPALLTLAGWFALASTADRYGRVSLDRMVASGLVYVAEVNAHLVPWVVVLVALPGIVACWRVKTGRRLPGMEGEASDAQRGRVDNAVRVLALFVLVLLALAAAHAPVRNVYFRYLLPGAPLAAGIVALLLVPPVRVGRGAQTAMVVCLAVMSTSEIPGFVSDRLLPGRDASAYLTRMHKRWRRPRSPFDLLVSFRDRRPGPLSETLRLLYERAQPNDVMVVTYGDQTLRYYSRITTLGGYGGEPLPAGLKPDWVWLRSDSPALKGPADVHAWVRDHVDRKDYDVIELPVGDRSFEVREDPHDYWYLREGSWPAVRLLHRRDPQTPWP